MIDWRLCHVHSLRGVIGSTSLPQNCPLERSGTFLATTPMRWRIDMKRWTKRIMASLLRDDDFQLLQELPSELFMTVLSKFCDGKSLSTLSLALVSSQDAFCQETAWYTIPTIVQKHLLAIAATLEENGLPDDVSNTAGAASWMSAIASTTATICDEFVERPERMRLLSENLAVLDFIQSSLSLYSRIKQPEWPVWCGRLSFTWPLDGTRMQRTAAVVVTAPMQYPAFIPGASLIFQRQPPTASFSCEPQNRRPIPPWGRIIPLAQDKSILDPVMEHLERWDQVAVPTTRTADVLNIAILTVKQANDRVAELPCKPKKSSWMLENANNQPSLMCCWHDDSLEGLVSSRDYIAFILRLMKVRTQLGEEVVLHKAS